MAQGCGELRLQPQLSVQAHQNMIYYHNLYHPYERKKNLLDHTKVTHRTLMIAALLTNVSRPVTFIGVDTEFGISMRYAIKHIQTGPVFVYYIPTKIKITKSKLCKQLFTY